LYCVGAVTVDKTIRNNGIDITSANRERETKEAYITDMSTSNSPKYTDKCKQ